MAWNDDNNQNPWGGNNQTPPEIDEVIKDFKKKFSGFVGSKKSSDNTPSIMGGAKYVVGLAALVLLMSGIYIIDPAEKGVVLRFGAFQEVTSQGPHWHIPLIETLTKVNVEHISQAEIGFRNVVVQRGRRFGGNVSSESLMLTKDENIIDAKFAVQYKIQDAKSYLFNVAQPDLTLRHVAESAIRQVVGKHNMDYIFEERGMVSQLIKDKSQFLLDLYQTGLEITTVNMKDAQPPEPVQSAFSDAVKAREDKQRLINEAETYANGILPQARGEGARIIENSKAYKSKVIARSEGEASRFTQIRVEYEKAPKVTRERLYRETMEQVLSTSSKIVVDSGTNSMMYLPIDKLIEGKKTANPSSASQAPSVENVNQNSNARNLFRSREVR